MKKNFWLSILAVIFVLSFTGCVFVDVDFDTSHSMTFSNQSKCYVSDWYVKDSNGDNHVKNLDTFYPVPEGIEKTIYNLPKDFYTVYFSFETNPGKFDYWKSSREVYLDKDKTYYLYNYSYNSVSDSFSRKAESNPKVTDFKMIDDKITTITLIDSEGNRIEFFKTEESFEK